MHRHLEEEDWTLILERIDDGECTPFLGAGACYGVLPLGCDIANEWAKKHDYPLKDSCSDLAKVTQFLAVKYDRLYPKGRLIKQFGGLKPPDFTEFDEPHSVLAELPLPVYITTNYDDYMIQALKFVEKEPKRYLCPWNSYLRKRQAKGEPDTDLNPSPKRPIVYHLHGHTGIKQSMVLTEDDYLDFLISISKDQDLLPPKIQEAFAGTTLLFMGYRLSDWDFRVLFRSIVSYLEKSIAASHVSVQLVSGQEETSVSEIEKAQEYLNEYFGKLEISVFWGTCREFAAELRRRWKEFQREK